MLGIAIEISYLYRAVRLNTLIYILDSVVMFINTQQDNKTHIYIFLGRQ